MHREDSTEVLVIGAGPVGLLTALLLAEGGVRVRLVDQESRPAAHSYACALHARSLALLDRLGLAEAALRQGRRIDSVAFYEGESRRAELKLAELGGRHPCVVVMAQSALENLLTQALKGKPKAEVDWNHRLSELKLEGQTVTATVDKLEETATGYIVPKWEWVVKKTRHVQANFVVGADGHNSFVRQSLGLEFEKLSRPESFAVFEFESEGDAGNEMRVTLGKGTTNVLWPLAGNRRRWSFQLLDKDVSIEFPAKDRSEWSVYEKDVERRAREQVQKFVRERAPWFEAKVQAIDWATDVQFEHGVVKQFGRAHCWLAGDAAHQTGPVGVQSMNVGLLEAEDLAGRLRKILRENAGLDLLETYGHNHREEWQRLLGIKAGLKPGAQAMPWVKEHSAQILSCIPATGEELARLAGQLGLEFA